MKRRDFLVRVSEIGRGVVLTPAVLTAAGLIVSGCGAASGGSGGGGEILAYDLVIEQQVDTGRGDPPHTHSFVILREDVDLGKAITRETDPTGKDHVHSVTISAHDLTVLGNQRIDGTTTMFTPISQSSTVGAHEHTWFLGVFFGT